MSSKGENKYHFLPLIFALGTLLLIGLALATQHYFPKLECPINAQLSIDCPGCGGTRATKSLLRGDIRSALSYNPLITLGILGIAGYCIISFCRKCLGKKPLLITFSIQKGILIMLIIIAFTIIRNL